MSAAKDNCIPADDYVNVKRLARVAQFGRNRVDFRRVLEVESAVALSAGVVRGANAVVVRTYLLAGG